MVFNTIFNRGKYENYKFGHTKECIYICVYILIYIYMKKI